MVGSSIKIFHELYLRLARPKKHSGPDNFKKSRRKKINFTNFFENIFTSKNFQFKIFRETD